MRILTLADNFLPHSGGARVYYYNLYRHLAEDWGADVTLLTKKVPGWRAFDTHAQTTHFQIRRRFKPLPTWKYQQMPKAIFPLMEALYLSKARRIDMIHSGDLYPPGVIAMFLKRFLGLPYLAYCHGDDVAQTEGMRYQPRVRNRLYLGAAAIIAANTFARNKLVSYGIPEDRIHIITPGVDTDIFRPGTPDRELVQRYGLDGKLVLLTAARLVPKKNHSLVFRALSQVLSEFPNVRYLVAGTGPEQGALAKQVAELGLGDVVQFIGDIPHDRLGEIYSLCDIFVMPNRTTESNDIETFGMVFVEANAAGKPVIGGRSGGTSEAIVQGTTGLIVDPGDPQELATALKLLLGNETLRRNFGASGLARVRQEFSWESRAGKLHDICVKVIRHHNGLSPAEQRT
jgi:phosphatidylinositol alpha-1,6-mannosyltransferase